MQTFFLLFFLTQIFGIAKAAELSIELRTMDNQAMQNAVIYLTPLNSQATSEPQTVAVMDQIDRQYSPHVLVVQKNAQVRFPNSDSIKHHVYSFSAAKKFELQLYRGLDANPLRFATTGVVELGCNIHDWMLGYILVVDTPYFAKTNIAGQLSFALPDGEYRLNIWHPRIVQTSVSLEHTVLVKGDNKITLRLEEPLLPDVNQYETVPTDVSEYE
ncbi:methylamine utilization protein [Paraglaciecola sp.]|uniref:methylamine utilization protein n=1 Tax=Paraglaciecola sp. TaxID=1920173 RepID=UPI0030F409F2